MVSLTDVIFNTMACITWNKQLACKNPEELRHGNFAKPVKGGPQKDRELVPF